MYHRIPAKANYYDCDQSNLLKISAAMKYMQQCSSEHLEHLGFSTEKLYAEHMVFLLSKMSVKIHRMPVCNERLVVGTAAITPRGVRFIREFILETPEGERLISALSLWVLVNPESRKIYRPASFPYPITFQEPGLDGLIDDIPLPRKVERGGTRMELPVRYSHLDVNRHINNTCYADFICDILPFEELTAKGIDLFAVSFQNEARYGALLDIARADLSHGEYYISGLHDGSACFEGLVRLNG